MHESSFTPCRLPAHRSRHEPVTAYIGLGGNLGDSAARLRAALAAIDKLPLTQARGSSSLYRSKPMGVIQQPMFINAVARIDTRLTPEALLTELQKIERRFGRIRKLRWGPRSLDLDILVYDAVIRERQGLTVPHPGIPYRSFVLYPLLEIAPNICIPGMGTPAELVRRCRSPVPARLQHARAGRDPAPDRASPGGSPVRGPLAGFRKTTAR